MTWNKRINSAASPDKAVVLLWHTTTALLEGGLLLNSIGHPKQPALLGQYEGASKASVKRGLVLRHASSMLTLRPLQTIHIIFVRWYFWYYCFVFVHGSQKGG